MIRSARQNGRQSGFTLVEVLIALFIFSLIAASTVYTLRLGLNARDQLTASDQLLQRMQGARLLLKDDLTQLLPRGTRDEFGNPLSRGFQGGEAANIRNFDDEARVLLRFVRNGWTNPDYADPRPSIQRVEYIARGDSLIRRIRPFPDEASDQPVTERVMLSGLADINIEFLINVDNGNLQWTSSWPVGENLSVLTNEPVVPPNAIKISFIHPRFGELSQNFWIGQIGGGV